MDSLSIDDIAVAVYIGHTGVLRLELEFNMHAYTRSPIKWWNICILEVCGINYLHKGVANGPAFNINSI